MNNTYNQEILSLEQIKNALSDRKLSVVAKKTGLSYPTLRRLIEGDVSDNHLMSTLKVISQYIIETNKMGDS